MPCVLRILYMRVASQSRLAYRLIYPFPFTAHDGNYFPAMFNGLFSPEVIAEVERAYQLNHDSGNTNVYIMDPDPSVSSNLQAKVNESNTPQAYIQTMIQECMKPKFPPPENLPCANVEVAKYRTCQNPGKLACSACKLVSYCSEVRY